MLKSVISYQGNCDEAINYYKEVLGAEVKEIAYFRDAPPDSGMEDMGLPPNFVMHSEVGIYGTTIVMTDGAEKPFSGISMLLAFDTAEEVTAVFNKLAKGGTIVSELAPQFWASLNGTVNDPFGIEWTVLTNN